MINVSREQKKEKTENVVSSFVELDLRCQGKVHVIIHDSLFNNKESYTCMQITEIH